MAIIKLAIRFEQTKIKIDADEGNIHKVVTNCIVFDRKRELLAIGEMRNEIIKQLTDPSSIDDLAFEPIYDGTEKFFSNTLVFLTYEIGSIKLAHRELIKPGFHLELDLPNYDQIDSKKRESFEFITLERLLVSIRSLTINDIKRGWPYWQRQTAAFSWILIVLVSMFLPLYLLRVPVMFAGKYFPLVLVASWLIAVTLIQFFGMLVLRTFLPKNLLRLIVAGPDENLKRGIVENLVVKLLL